MNKEVKNRLKKILEKINKKVENVGKNYFSSIDFFDENWSDFFLQKPIHISSYGGEGKGEFTYDYFVITTQDQMSYILLAKDCYNSWDSVDITCSHYSFVEQEQQICTVYKEINLGE